MSAQTPTLLSFYKKKKNSITDYVTEKKDKSELPNTTKTEKGFLNPKAKKYDVCHQLLESITNKAKAKSRAQEQVICGLIDESSAEGSSDAIIIEEDAEVAGISPPNIAVPPPDVTSDSQAPMAPASILVKDSPAATLTLSTGGSEEGAQAEAVPISTAIESVVALAGQGEVLSLPSNATEAASLSRALQFEVSELWGELCAPQEVTARGELVLALERQAGGAAGGRSGSSTAAHFGMRELALFLEGRKGALAELATSLLALSGVREALRRQLFASGALQADKTSDSEDTECRGGPSVLDVEMVSMLRTWILDLASRKSYAGGLAMPATLEGAAAAPVSASGIVPSEEQCAHAVWELREGLKRWFAEKLASGAAAPAPVPVPIPEEQVRTAVAPAVEKFIGSYARSSAAVDLQRKAVDFARKRRREVRDRLITVSTAAELAVRLAEIHVLLAGGGSEEAAREGVAKERGQVEVRLSKAFVRLQKLPDVYAIDRSFANALYGSLEAATSKALAQKLRSKPAAGEEPVGHSALTPVEMELLADTLLEGERARRARAAARSCHTRDEPEATVANSGPLQSAGVISQPPPAETSWTTAMGPSAAVAEGSEASEALQDGAAAPSTPTGTDATAPGANSPVAREREKHLRAEERERQRLEKEAKRKEEEDTRRREMAAAKSGFGSSRELAKSKGIMNRFFMGAKSRLAGDDVVVLTDSPGPEAGAPSGASDKTPTKSRTGQAAEAVIEKRTEGKTAASKRLMFRLARGREPDAALQETLDAVLQDIYPTGGAPKATPAGRFVDVAALLAESKQRWAQERAERLRAVPGLPPS